MRTSQLRFALLASLGALPLSCGGTSQGGESGNVKCTSPQTDPQTGLVTCAEGYQHRPTAKTCGGSVVSGGDQKALPRTDTNDVSCEADPNVCAAYQYGYCQSGQLTGPMCASGCATDQDCPGGAICVCGNADAWGICVAAACATNDDCAPGYRCASVSGLGTSYACQTPNDTCDSDPACLSSESCQIVANGARACSPRPVAGRPFLVAQQVRVAPIVRRSDWLLSPTT